MTSSYPEFSGADDAVESAAAEWLIERDQGFAPGRAAQFAAWRAAQPAHEAAVIRLERTLDLIAEMPDIRAPLENRIAAEAKVIRPAGFRLPYWISGLAALLALALGVWWIGSLRPAGVERYATAATRQQQIALTDGSILNLNVSTEVQVALTPESRRIELTAGEAHFAVAPDTARPFIVSAGGVYVRAVGTAFSVRLGREGVEVLVNEGKVEVTREPLARAPASAVERPVLVAGERTLITRDETPASAPAKVVSVSPNDLSAAMRWHSRMMTFTDLPLRDAVALFNRRNLQQVVLADPDIGDRRIGGTFAADQVEAFVRLLAQDGDIAVERRNSSEIVLRRAR